MTLWAGVLISLVAALSASPALRAQESLPHLVRQGDRHALVVDGQPYLLLGAQINNSSAWPAVLPQVWPALADLHANTVEAPVYWESMEPAQGHFDFGAVDAVIEGAREHQLRVVLLWFGTWKNGQNHYVPEWIKTDTVRYPREISAAGKLLDVMSPTSAANLQADKTAFAALMHHLREVDGEKHTVIMVQVENESGAIGTVRDHSPAADRQFAAAVPPVIAKAAGRPAGTWQAVFGQDAEERYAAYSTARYINEVAQAGKAEYPLPMYCNIWITYPVHALTNRDRPSPGQEYPSGGPQQGNVSIWKAAAPAIDILAPDFYSDNFGLFKDVVATYNLPNNPLFFPETGMSGHFGRDLFYALGHGAIGFSPFGVDYTDWTLKHHELLKGFAEDYQLLAPMSRELAQWNMQGKLHTVVETPGQAREDADFGDIVATASFGFPQRDGEMPPGTNPAHGHALVAQTGPMDFVVTGVDASVTFALRPDIAQGKNEQLEILRVEQGQYKNGVWTSERLWNGDQTDRGLQFHEGTPQVVRIWLHTLPLDASTLR